MPPSPEPPGFVPLPPRVPDVPKVANFFWTGAPLSWLRSLTIQSFADTNPDYEIRLWQMNQPALISYRKRWKTAETLDYLNYDGPDFTGDLRKCKVDIREYIPIHPRVLPPNFHCELWRWATAFADGGWFFDMDFLFVDKLPETKSSLVVCLSESQLTVGAFACIPGLRFFRDVWFRADKSTDIMDYQAAGSVAWANTLGGSSEVSGRNWESLFKQQYELEPQCLPLRAFYPTDWRSIDLLWKPAMPLSLPAETVALHWFGGSPESQKWNAMLTPGNVGHYNCPVAQVAGAYV